MTDPLAGLLRSLQLAGLDIDAEAALDSVWLGLRMREKAVAGTIAEAGATADSVPSGTASSGAPGDGTMPESAAGGRQRDTLTSPRRQYPASEPVTGAAAAPARTLTLARAAALPESRELIKALRPLRRRVRSPGTGVLDIATTVRRAAEEDLWIPSFASARERWLDVLLVADHGLSMIIWKDTIDEFERVLRNSGAFRSVRSWWLETGLDQPAMAPRGRAPSPATPKQLTRLVRGEARSVVLVISDCVGPRWHDGSIPELIADWSALLPVALVQVTPEWFWARTALGDTVSSRFRSPVPASVNRRFRWDATALGAGGVTRELEPTLLRVPAATLTAAPLARVAGLLAGVGREWTPGVVFDLTWEGDEDAPQRPAATADERVARFRALASKPAQRLAACYAASPVRTLGVLRLLRRDLLPDAGPFTEAEVLLGGVVRVRREEALWDLGAGLPLEFFPGVQPLLLDGAVAGDVVRVLTHAASVAASGVGPTFTSWLSNPSSGMAQLDPSESAFAASAAEVLARLGGAYARIVRPRPASAAETAPPPAAESQAVPQEERDDVAVEPERGFIGQPHQVPLPKVLVGRNTLMNNLRRWLLDAPGGGEERETESGQRPMVLLGEAGIGKSAVAGRVLRDWHERWPGEAAFVWCFQRDPRTRNALQALQDRYAGPRRRTDGITAAMLDGLRGRARSLVVFDGIDGIQDSTELQQLIHTAELMAAITSARVLFTARQRPEASHPLEVVVGPLGREDFGSLIADALGAATEGALSQQPGAAEMTQVLYELSGGNPLVALTLLPKAVSLTPPVVLEELGQLSGPRPTIAPAQLAETMDLLDRAARARELATTGNDLLEKHALGDAFSAFDEVVRIRAQLPSRRLQAHALLARGRVSIMTAQYDRATADVAEAVELYRAVSPTRELVAALQLLAVAHAAAGRIDEAIALLAEALSIVRTTEDQRGMLGVLSQLATVQAQRGSFEEALLSLRQARVVAERMGDERARGNTHLQTARLLRQMTDIHGASRPAIASFQGAIVEARAAADLFRSVNDTALVAEAVAEIEQLEQLQKTPSEADRVESVEYLVSGRVQGVGFRYMVQQVARELGIQGEATNLPDGRVRVQATGTRSQLDQLEARLRRGPAGATVDHLEIRLLDDGGARTRGESPGRPPDAADRVQSVEYVVTGHVAGVGFRHFVQQVARELGIQGEATNLRDGRVRVQATGPRSRLDQLETRLRQGPPAAKVDRLDIRILDEEAGNETGSKGAQSMRSEAPSRLKRRPDGQRAVIAIGIRKTGSLPELSEAVNAARSIAEWATTSQHMPPDRVTLLTDESGPVTTSAISAAVRSVISLGSMAQLVIYFAGYSTTVWGDMVVHQWLLTRAPDDLSSAIDVDGCVTLARSCGVPHVVFISDTCHVSATAISAMGLAGEAVFPDLSKTGRLGTVDQFHAVPSARPSSEMGNANTAASRYHAMYTKLLLSAIKGHDRSLLEEREGVRFLRPRALGQYLARAVTAESASVGTQQEPEMRIESGQDAWLATFEEMVDQRETESLM